MLEQMMYQPMQESKEELRVYQVEDLESLSASILYYGSGVKMSSPIVGMTLEGGLKIKKVGKNTLTLTQDNELLRDLYTFHPDGSGALRNIALTKGKSTLINKKSW
jgi:hypothetical protein